MAKRRGNRNWGKPAHVLIPFSLSTFEHVVKTLRLSPDQYKNSLELKEWVSSKLRQQPENPMSLAAQAVEANTVEPWVSGEQIIKGQFVACGQRKAGHQRIYSAALRS